MQSQAFDRYYMLLKFGYAIALFAHLLFIFFFQYLGLPTLVYFNVMSVTLYVIALWMLYKRFYNTSLALISFEVVGHAYLTVYMLGWESGFHYYLFTLMMGAAFNPYWHVIVKFSYVALISVAYSYLGYYTSIHLPVVNVDNFLLNLMQSFNITVSYMFVGYLAHIYALAAFNAENRLRHLATKDPLTGLYNRRELLRIFDLELIKNRRNQIPFSMIMVDIDDFKKINDAYGHQCGDEALVAVGNCFKRSIREQDFVARWGGEEFMFLLPETNMEGAIVLAEKLYDAVKELESSCDEHLKRISITLSVGEHQFNETQDELILRIDNGLLKGKESGKNQIICV